MMENTHNLEELLKRLRAGMPTPEDTQEITRMLQDKALTPREINAIQMAVIGGANRAIKDRERQEREKERQRRERRRNLASRVGYALAVTVILGVFVFLNIVSAHEDWGVSALHIIAAKWTPGVCQYGRCIARGDQVRHYTFIGLTKEERRFCGNHIGSAPETIGQTEPWLGLLSASLVTIALAAFFVYRVYKAMVKLSRWDDQETSEALLLLLLACLGLYAGPTILSYFVGL